MASDDQELALENWLNRATNPVNREEDWEFIMGFCDQVNQELEGPQIACRLISHKIQSPQEREAMLTLSTLEACVKNCGRRFHQEIGKFRFLNEIIKVISPKYYGGRTPERIKRKCVELLYSWSKGLTHENKILEAYTMLKSQGVITADPEYMDSLIQTIAMPGSERAKHAVFEDDEKSKLLARLLKSRSPEDLQAANRLIKNMVKEDNDRMDRVSRRVNELEKMLNNMTLLSEMMDHYTETGSSQADKDMMKELFDTLEKNRPILFKLASETDEKDNDGINEILKTNDEMMKVMNQYKHMVQKIGDSDGTQEDCLLDVDVSPQKLTTIDTTDSTSMLQDQLAAFGLGDVTQPPVNPASNDVNLFSDFQQFPVTSGGMMQQGGSVMMQQGGVGMVPQVSGGMMPQTNPILNNPMVHSPYPAMQRPMYPGPQSRPNYASLFAHSGLPSSNTPSPRVTTPANRTTPPSLSAMDDLKTLGKDWLTKPPQSMAPTFPTQPSMQPSIQTINQSTIPNLQPMIPANKPTQSLFQPSNPATQPTNTLIQPSLQPSHTIVQPTKPIPPSAPLIQPAADNVPTIPPPTANLSQNTPQPLVNVTTQLNNAPGVSDGPLLSLSPPLSPPSSLVTPPSTPTTLSLSDVFVALESIKPGSIDPVKAYEKSGLKIMIHFGKDTPRPDITVMVVSVMSTNDSAISAFTLQAAVPKVMKVKLQPPSATALPAYNPILPPAAITQVMLLANPTNERVRLKFKLKYSINDKEVTDFGDVDSFPRS